MSADDPMEEMPEELYLNSVEKIVLNGEQTKAALAELAELPGWKWLMRHAHDKAWKNIQRWITSDLLTKEDLDQRNLDMRQAKAIMMIPQLLRDAREGIDARIERERNPE